MYKFEDFKRTLGQIIERPKKLESIDDEIALFVYDMSRQICQAHKTESLILTDHIAAALMVCLEVGLLMGEDKREVLNVMLRWIEDKKTGV